MEPTIPELYERFRDFDLVVDSRRVVDPARTLFVALPGARTDGHRFIPELLAAGVRYFLVGHKYVPAKALPPTEYGASAQVPGKEAGAKGRRRWTAVYPQGTFRYVMDPLRVLQELARHHREQFPAIPVVAITGSNGKTIVKDWLAQLLGKRYNVCASPRSYNSQIGVALAVWRLRPEHDIAVFEAGVSRSGEMERLREMIQPTHGVFTMLGSAHDAGFPDRQTKLREKLCLFADVRWVVVRADDTAVVRRLRTMDVEVEPFLGVEGRILEVAETPLRLPFPSLPAIYLDNAYTAAAAAYLLEVPEHLLKAELPLLEPLSNRLEQREGLAGGVVINDSYSNDTSALAAALDFAVAQHHFPDLILVLGTLQLGSVAATPASRDRALQNAVRPLLEGRVTRLITVGATNVCLAADHHFATPQALLTALPELDFSNATTLVKGASYERLDRVANALSRKQHATVLRLDLTALRYNFSLYRERARTKMIVMVKASAYGGGALPVARTLTTAGADYLAVAYPDEGVCLREGGIRLPVMVLNAAPAAYARCGEYDLEPVVHRTEDLRLAFAAGLRPHLEIDTGMGRLGFQQGALPELFEALRQLQPKDRIASVFTHLSAADDPVHDAFTEGQLAAFDVTYDQICAAANQRPPRHALNTNGIARFERSGDDYVRLGIGLYGIGDETMAPSLRPALSLLTTITRVYDRPAGERVGYGRRGHLERDSRIAVLPIGYADGLPRLAGEGRFSVRVGQHFAPTVGSVCMDMTMVDVTDIPRVGTGAEVIIFGPAHPIALLAESAQTIPYEILTGIGGRVHRVYWEE